MSLFIFLINLFQAHIFTPVFPHVFQIFFFFFYQLGKFSLNKNVVQTRLVFGLIQSKWAVVIALSSCRLTGRQIRSAGSDQ